MVLSPLTHVHFQLSGGWRQNGLIAGVYAALLILIASIVYGTTDVKDRGSVSATLLSITGVAQVVLALVIAPGAVRRAVQRDFQAGMIESHRLTPLSGLSLVTGYLTGPTAQALLLLAVGMLVGGYFAGLTGQSYGYPGVAISSWSLSQLCLLSLSLLVVSLALLASLATAGKTNIMAVLIAFALLGGWFLVPLVPGLALLMGFMSAGLLLKWLGAPVPITGAAGATVWAMVLQVVLALIFLRAACRKIRAPEQAVFSIPLGLLLVVVTGVTLVAGWHLFGQFTAMFGWGQVHAAQWISSTWVFVLVALFPLVAAAVERQRRDRAAVLTVGRLPRWRDVDALPVLLTGLTMLATVVMMPWKASGGAGQGASALVGTALAIGLSFWTDYAWACFVLARGQRLFRALLLAWAVLKGLPLLADGVAALVSEILMYHERIEWHVAGLSPIGTLILLAEGANIWPGLGVQFGIAVLATVLLRRARARRQVTRGPRPAPA